MGGSLTTRDERVLELVGSGLFEGLLSLTPLTLDDTVLAAPLPVEVFGIYDEHLRGIGPLADGSPVGELVRGLAAQGHRTFLHVAGDLGHESARLRRDAYLDAVRDLGLRSYGVVESEWRPESAVQAILELPADSGVTAVVAANDLLAAGVVHGATARGWQIPRDLSVTGYDSNVLGAWLSPALTTVQVDHAGLGRSAMRRLVARLRDEPLREDPTPRTTVVWRDSVGPAPAAHDAEPHGHD
ncbi:substrate-binding domain-containing protein [Actinotalea sp. M2MS4P-6]|uniref:LacI family DNA-binding transcriptional regulator n=1 Tax=Actinotalea sp. M2MS4P-6 TaxID=2983762 RepID=UPI0021E3789B|nr:substrate-binding domain-containing protein [Actinotalea sp. M2MS4P-6]MCV2394442.1 substrate-binding domain-containing protein [Actinotalea sp. M2MS4P-6]